LIKAAGELVVARGGAEIVLGVSRDNADAGRLYSLLGYMTSGIVDVTSYTWVDMDGVEHDATEEGELLVKVVRSD